MESKNKKKVIHNLKGSLVMFGLFFAGFLVGAIWKEPVLSAFCGVVLVFLAFSIGGWVTRLYYDSTVAIADKACRTLPHEWFQNGGVNNDKN